MAGSKDGRERRDKKNHYRRAAVAHPVRQRILCMVLNGRETGAADIAVELAEAPSRIAYHLRVLTKRRALKGRSKGPPTPPAYRLAPQALWVRKMLIELGRQDEEGNPGGRD